MATVAVVQTQGCACKFTGGVRVTQLCLKSSHSDIFLKIARERYIPENLGAIILCKQGLIRSYFDSFYSH